MHPCTPSNKKPCVRSVLSWRVMCIVLPLNKLPRHLVMKACLAFELCATEHRKKKF